MFSDEEIKESSLMRPGDEIISIREVCLIDKYDKKYLGNEPLLSNSSRNELEVPRLFRDGFFSEGLDPQARFAWTEEDGNIASLVSEPGFGTTGQTTFGTDLDAALTTEIKEDTSSSGYDITRNELTLQSKSQVEANAVSSTSTGNGHSISQSKGRTTHKVDKADPRSRYHYVKYVKRHGRTVKLWECGICSREFQHQYTLMRHLPTHTDERNFHCDECSKSFRQLSTLSQHRAIHSAERPYACEVCNKTFNRVSTLISHRKTHSDEKPYKCHICPKGFHQKGNLRNHLFTHTNERPYRCNICMKGFNQQSNLVCHKNKAHPDENNVNTVKSRNASRVPILSATETQTDLTRPPSDQCEVSSSVGPYLPPDQAISIWPKPIQFNASRPSSLSSDLWNESPWGSNGVIVDPINTYHMGIALATRQTPFALLKSDNGTPVLVKVVDTKLPGGKQMLVPATAEDLKIGGKIVLNKEVALATTSEVNSAVQIRVPVVATVVPKIRPGGKLQLSVEEPHHVYHNTLSSNGGEQKENPCTASAGPSIPTNLPPLEPLRRLDLNLNEHNIRTSRSYSPAPSSPLDLISLDLFEPIGCIPLGPQITSVDNIEQPPPSEDSDIFIEKFEEIIPLSDSD
ncbi:zinc finger protein 415-like [Vanessa atalanta]|uniref:zinc finger protein 415-like n=1 Tax=Vanessa atalanta TaxID=42275 RepID=UPI001FCD7DC2|nr:zinc finger protein 415-like [Vanessa atalanta]